jgi:hypothetical protein
MHNGKMGWYHISCPMKNKKDILPSADFYEVTRSDNAPTNVGT